MEHVNSTAIRAAIEDARNAFIAALRRGDLEATASAYAEDARLLAPSAEVLSGRSSILRFWQAGVEAGVDAIDLVAHEVEVEAGGDVAYEIGRYVLSLRPPDGPAVTDRGRYLLVYRRGTDGSWRRAVETFSADAGAASAPLPGTRP